MRRDACSPAIAVEQELDLERERVAPAEDVPGRPPVARERMLGSGHESAGTSAVGDQQLVEALEVEGDRAARAVHLERVLVHAPDARGGTTRACRRRRSSNSTVADEGVVDLMPLDERPHDRRDGDRLADEVAAQVDDVRAQVAQRSGAGLRAVEAPARRRASQPHDWR